MVRTQQCIKKNKHIGTCANIDRYFSTVLKIPIPNIENLLTNIFANLIIGTPLLPKLL